MESVKKMFRVLSFRASREDMQSFTEWDFALGLFITWLVGAGRYWDDPGALPLQYLGFGSLIYIFVLAGLIYILLLPFRIENWNFLNLLTFISFTSLPAALYAIPVERFMDMEQAATANKWFLLTVAVWRVALLVYFLNVAARLKFAEITVATMLPLTVIVTALSMLNLERAVFELMGGIREHTTNDGAYVIVMMLTGLAWITLIPMLLMYIFIAFQKNMGQNGISPEKPRRSIAGLVGTRGGKQMTKLTPLDANAVSEQLSDGKAVLVDIREPEEYAAEHIAGAVHMPLSTIDGQSLTLAAGQHAVFHCRSGARTDTHAVRLAAVAPGASFVLEGGLKAWKAAGLPTQS